MKIVTYKGMYHAVHNGKIIGSAYTKSVLHEQLERKGHHIEHRKRKVKKRSSGMTVMGFRIPRY